MSVGSVGLMSVFKVSGVKTLSMLATKMPVVVLELVEVELSVSVWLLGGTECPDGYTF